VSPSPSIGEEHRNFCSVTDDNCHVNTQLETLHAYYRPSLAFFHPTQSLPSLGLVQLGMLSLFSHLGAQTGTLSGALIVSVTSKRRTGSASPVCDTTILLVTTFP
jgi:hypothetical protein